MSGADPQPQGPVNSNTLATAPPLDSSSSETKSPISSSSSSCIDCGDYFLVGHSSTSSEKPDHWSVALTSKSAHTSLVPPLSGGMQASFEQMASIDQGVIPLPFLSHRGIVDIALSRKTSLIDLLLRDTEEHFNRTLYPLPLNKSKSGTPYHNTNAAQSSPESRSVRIVEELARTLPQRQADAEVGVAIDRDGNAIVFDGYVRFTLLGL